MDLNYILLIVAALNLGSDLVNAIRLRDRLPRWIPRLVIGCACACFAAWLIAPTIAGYVSAVILFAYIVTMKMRTRKKALVSLPFPVTKLLIGVNCVAFVMQLYYGASSDPEQLIKIGALFPPFLNEQGEWWRLITAQYLHFGAAHLAFNMLGLWFLGPTVEQIVGHVKFVIGYTVSGVGGMLIACGTYWWGFSEYPSVLVGASASVLGLVGMTGALTWGIYRRTGNLVAKARFATMAQIVALQAVFDALVPEVSSTAHLGGAATGALIGLLYSLLSKDTLGRQRRI